MEHPVVVGIMYAADGTFHALARTRNASVKLWMNSRVNGGLFLPPFLETDKSPRNSIIGEKETLIKS